MEDKPRTNHDCRDLMMHGVDWAVQVGATEEVMLGVRKRMLRRRHRRFATTAGAVAVLSIAGILWFSTGPAGQSTPRTHSGEAQTSLSPIVVNAPEVRTLPDGSIVEVRTGTEISVAYSAGIRLVKLVQGEAYFKVVKNDREPFIVTTRGVEARAVGTEFAVQLADKTVGVLVTQGRVAVQKAPVDPTKTPPPETLATVEAGTCVVVDTATLSADLARVADNEIRQRMAWRTPLLEFTQTPLSEVVATINREGSHSLILADASLGNVKISGTLRANNVDTLLHLLADEYRIEADSQAEGQIVLRARR